MRAAQSEAGKKKSAERVAKYAQMFSAMGTEPRLRIMQLLLSAHPEGLVVGEIQEELDIPNSTLSHHLDKLKAEDLVRVERKRHLPPLHRGHRHVAGIAPVPLRRVLHSQPSREARKRNTKDTMDTQDTAATDIKDVVREKYGQTALRVGSGGSSCCGATPSCGCDPITSNLYDASQTDQIPEQALQASLGCGNPTALAQLNGGEIVLDLGSGGGIDVLLSAKRVGATGKAYGLDMTDEMLALANENKRKAGVENVEFLKGEIEHIPLPDKMRRRRHLELRDQSFRR